MDKSWLQNFLEDVIDELREIKGTLRLYCNFDNRNDHENNNIIIFIIFVTKKNLVNVKKDAKNEPAPPITEIDSPAQVAEE